MKRIIFLIFVIVLVSCCVQISLTPYQVVQQRDSLLEQKIVVGGMAEVDKLICTLMICPEDNPCCNSCAGSLSLKGEKEKILIIGEYKGKEIGCKGNNCMQECYPLEKGKNYEVKGVWKKFDKEYYLELESFRLSE